MRKILVVALLAFVAAFAVGCERKEEGRPIVPQGATPAFDVENELKVLRGLVRDDPGNTQAWIKLGNMLMDGEKYAEAIEAYGKALELNPSNVDVRVDRGICYRQIGRSDIAAEHFRKAIEINPKHLNANKNLGVVLTFDLKDLKGGREAFEKYLELAPNAPDRAQIEKLIADIKAAEKAPTP